MSKRLTQNEKYRFVMEHDELLEAYFERTTEARMVSLPGKCIIGGKKVGITRYNNACSFIASRVYDEFCSPDLFPVKQLNEILSGNNQLTLSL